MKKEASKTRKDLCPKKKSRVNGWTLLSRKLALRQEIEDLKEAEKAGVKFSPSIIEGYKQQLAEVNKQLAEDRQKEQRLKSILFPEVKK